VPDGGESGAHGRELRVCALYPDLMNIYADRGNLLLLERRCRWRGIGFRLSASSLGDELDPAGADLFYIGGGQDRDQRLCAFDLAEHKREALHAVAARGGVILAVCGGYQLLGHSYQLGEESLPGAGLVDLWTVRADDVGGDGAGRLIGNVAIEVKLESGGPPAVLAGFENHGGRTQLGPSARPLGRVLQGHGNNDRDGYEGVRDRGVIGTYLHGPLLPKNVWFADWLIQTALGLRQPLSPLEDELEQRAHAEALRAAGV
jgi:lipid II isoglutaminyl synthase (glutamine-hydrolysing)